MKKVFIPNRSHHDFSGAERFGKLVFLTEGYINRFNVNHIFRLCTEAMADAEVEDWLLVSSLSVVNAAASAILAHRFGRVNFLTYDANTGNYVPEKILVEGYQGNDEDGS